jgi:polysaccharide biosynthesis protein PslH
MHRFVGDLIAREEIDTIFAFSGQMAQFVPTGGAHFLMDFVDVDSAKFEDFGRRDSSPLGWLHCREGRLLGGYERAVASRADVSLFVTEAEAALFRSRIAPATARVEALGNGIDLDFYDPQADFAPLAAGMRPAGPLIVFTGQMDYRPNVEAVAAFAQDVMPRIRARRADAQFAVVGRRPTPAVRRLDGRNGTIVTGEVADVRSWLGAADVVVAPLTIARGIQNKLLEAMAMARPVVASPAGFEGVDAVPGRDLLIAATTGEQAEAVLGLLEDPVRARAMADAGRLRMEQSYSWAARLAPLATLVGTPPRRAAA